MGHRKLIRHYHEPGHLHEFTFSCFRRRPLLTNDVWRERLGREIDEANVACRFELVAFVFMPEHVHLLTYPVGENPDFGLYLARIKQPFSKYVKAALDRCRSPLLEQLTVRERKNKYCFRFWQAGAGFDRNLFSTEAVVGAINYIHENPVKRGLCKRAVDWRWSSARYYRCEPPRQQVAGLPYIHGVPTGLLD